MNEIILNLEKYSDVINSTHLTRDSGKVTGLAGELMTSPKR